MITIKSKREIELMRAAGKLAAECLVAAGEMVKPGVTSNEINEFVHQWTIDHDAIPAPLNYRGYPKSVCVSVNEVVCHGIPNDRTLQEGDIVNIDVTPILNGYHGDTSKTFFVGKVSPEAKKLVATTYEALWLGIKQVKPGNRIGAIGNAIETFVKPKGYSIVLDYCGHGIGKNFHEDPMVIHAGRANAGPIMKEGMTFTIEPMINIGTASTYVMDDDWTVKTEDGELSAQFEHTVLVTADGVEVLTLREGEQPL